MEQRVKSNEQRKESNEQRAKSNEQRAKITSNDQKLTSNEQQTKGFTSNWTNLDVSGDRCKLEHRGLEGMVERISPYYALQIPDSRYEKKNTQIEHIIAHFEYFFTCHYSKTVWLTENLNEIKVTHYEKIFSHI